MRKNQNHTLRAGSARILRAIAARANPGREKRTLSKPQHAGCVRSQRVARVVGILLTALSLLVQLACGAPETKPVDIAAEDVCIHCKMAISERQFAAEFITPDGDASKFDDIGCMLDYLKEKPDTKVAAHFFMDYETKQWVNGRAASFTKSAEITSPMSGGIIAFQDKAKAEAAATKYKGKTLNFEELTKQ